MPPLDVVLRDVLACPKCHGPLTVHEEGTSTEVHCPRCHRAWPVVDGIPRMVPEHMAELPPTTPSGS